MSELSLFENRDFLNLEECAQYFRCTKTAVRSLVDDGLPCQKLGVRFVFSREQIKRWFEENAERFHYAEKTERQIPSKVARGWETAL